jgi:hypothetical protein
LLISITNSNLLERLSTLRYFIYTILEITKANREGEDISKNKVKEIPFNDKVIVPTKGKGKGKVVNKSTKE